MCVSHYRPICDKENHCAHNALTPAGNHLNSNILFRVDSLKEEIDRF